MRFSTPMTDALNTRRRADLTERSGASRQKAGGFAGTDSGDPRCGVSRAKSGLFFWTVHGPFSFQQD